MARSDWQYVTGSTNNNSVFFTGIRWKYRDDLFGTTGYPSDRISSNTDIIEYQPYISRTQGYTSYSYTSWKTSYYKYSYNTTSGSDPSAADNQLNISTTFRFDKASNSTKYYPVTGSLSSGNVFNTSSTTLSRIIQVPHCSDGSSKLRLYFYVKGDSNTSFHYGETNQIVTLEGIPRYTTITSFTVSKRNETSFTFNWNTADTIDYVWYSTNDGSSWAGYDVTDGTSGSFTVSGLSPNTTYKCKLRVRRKDSQLTTDSGAVSQTTYAAPSQSLRDKTETTISMNWSCDTNASSIQYSTNNGSSWSSSISASGTSGYYTISGLTANTTYNIKTRVTRSGVGTSYDTSASSQTTYNYPYITGLSATNLTIGNSQTVTLYNPKGRSCTVYMKKGTTTSGTQLSYNTTSTTSVTLQPSESTLYSSISGASYSDCVYYVVCSDPSHTSGTYSGKYIVNETINKPTLSSSSFLDTNSTTSHLTSNSDTSSKIVLNGSTLQISVTIAGKNYASISTIKIEGVSRTVTAGGSGANLTGSATYSITKPDKSTFSVEATDSRGLPYSGTISIESANVVDYIPLTLIGTATRNQPTDGKVNLGVSGKYFNASFGYASNTLTVQYRYKESTSSTWTQGWTSNGLTVTPSDNTYNGSTSSPLTGFDYTKMYNVEFQVTDQLNTVNGSVLVSKGQPVFWWNDNNFNIMKRLNVSDYTKTDLFATNKNDASGLTTGNANGIVKFLYNVSDGNAGLFDHTNNANAVIHLNKHNGNYDSQLGFSSNGNVYYKSCNGTTLNNESWKRIPFATEIPSNSSFTLAGLGEKSYNNLTDKPTIPTVNNATLTIQKNGSTVKTFTANASSNVTANITVPTNTNELTNGAGFITGSGATTITSNTNGYCIKFPSIKYQICWWQSGTSGNGSGINNNSVYTTTKTFASAFSGTPAVIPFIISDSSAGSFGNMSIATWSTSNSSTQLRVYNNSGSTRYPHIGYLAIGQYS